MMRRLEVYRASAKACIAVGGLAVLASYAYTLLEYPELSGGLWGDLPPSLLPFYQVCMLLAATGYFFLTYFLLFRLDPRVVRIAGRFGYSLFHVLYLLILIPSALWTPLTLVMLRAPSPWLWAIIRLTLAAVALGVAGAVDCLAHPTPEETPMGLLGSGHRQRALLHTDDDSRCADLAGLFPLVVSGSMIASFLGCTQSLLD
jgi:hypothetical protein